MKCPNLRKALRIAMTVAVGILAAGAVALAQQGNPMQSYPYQQPWQVAPRLVLGIYGETVEISSQGPGWPPSVGWPPGQWPRGPVTASPPSPGSVTVWNVTPDGGPGFSPGNYPVGPGQPPAPTPQPRYAVKIRSVIPGSPAARYG